MGGNVRTITIKGHARPKGSWNAIPVRGKIRFVPVSTPAAKWFKYLESEVKRKWPLKKPWVGPVRVECVFKLSRPKSNTNEFPITQNMGDVDKLLRAVFDAMSGVVFNDDSQVVETSAKKIWATNDPEVYIKVKRLRVKQ